MTASIEILVASGLTTRQHVDAKKDAQDKRQISSMTAEAVDNRQAKARSAGVLLQLESRFVLVGGNKKFY